MKKIVSILLLVCVVLGMSSCSPNPEGVFVAGKNNGVFENRLNNPDRNNDSNEKSLEENNLYTYTIVSKDESITYNLELTTPKMKSEPAVIQVTPAYITSETAEQVAHILMGDVPFYEYSQKMSKQEIESIILSLKQQISNSELLQNEYGDEAEFIIERTESLIEQYEAEYAIAPETIEVRECDWVFHPQSYYSDQVGMDILSDEYESYNKSEFIKATTELNGLPYVLSVCNRDANDYRMHSFFCYADDLQVSPEIIYSHKEPTIEEIEEAVKIAEKMLSEMPLGEWIVDSSTVTTRNLGGDAIGYQITITATPVYNGTAVLHRNQIMNIKSENAFAPNYYYEEITFGFSAGQLIFFELLGLLEIVEIVNEDVEILGFDEAIERFKTMMQLTELSPGGVTNFFSYNGVESVDICVDGVEIGLIRVMAKNNTTDFYLIPVYKFSGYYTCGYDENGNVVMTEDEFDVMMGVSSEVPMELITINAVDGSVVDSELGY